MNVLACVNFRRVVNGHELNITARNLGDNLSSEHRALLITRTVAMWEYLSRLINNNQRICPETLRTPEESITAESGYTFEPFSETRCTVFDWKGEYGLTIHSDTIPQQALDIYYARVDAETELARMFPAASTQSTPAPAYGSQSAPIGDGQAVEGNRAPSSNAKQYQDGQLVWFAINKIAVGSNKGSVTFALWSPKWTKYPLKTIYKTKNNSPELSFEYNIAKEFLATLGLSLDKPEVTGNWKLTCKVAHNGDKEYLNVVSIEPF